MVDPKTPRKDNPSPPPKADEGPSPRKRRRRGYRGYPNTAGGTDVHFGSGFGGAGSTSATGVTGLPKPDVISERTKDDVEDET